MSDVYPLIHGCIVFRPPILVFYYSQSDRVKLPQVFTCNICIYTVLPNASCNPATITLVHLECLICLFKIKGHVWLVNPARLFSCIYNDLMIPEIRLRTNLYGAPRLPSFACKTSKMGDHHFTFVAVT